NGSQQATDKVVFNVHAHYAPPDKDIGLLAKTLELLRLAPSEAIDFNGPPGDVRKVTLVAGTGNPSAAELPFHYLADNATALEVGLPAPVLPGQAVVLDLTYHMRLPQRQGRWGQWNGITFLAQWLPVLAVHNDHGWQPVPFVPWHQPFYNEAGLYTVR